MLPVVTCESYSFIGQEHLACHNSASQTLGKEVRYYGLAWTVCVICPSVPTLGLCTPMFFVDMLPMLLATCALISEVDKTGARIVSCTQGWQRWLIKVRIQCRQHVKGHTRAQPAAPP